MSGVVIIAGRSPIELSIDLSCGFKSITATVKDTCKKKAAEDQ
jgi:hypothetical protein